MGNHTDTERGDGIVKQKESEVFGAQAQPLSTADLTQVSGGVSGYSTVRCKKCGKTFTDLDQYQKHLLEAHKAGAVR